MGASFGGDELTSKFIKIAAILFPFFLLHMQCLAASAGVFGSAGPIRVGVYQNEPKVFLDAHGKPSGFWIDLLEHIATEEHWQLAYVPCTWQQCLENLEKGELDLMVDVAYSESRAKKFDFNQEGGLSNWAQIYTRPFLSIDNIEELADKKIAVMKGDISFECFKLFGFPAEYILCDDFQSVFESIHTKRADAGIISRLYGQLHEADYRVGKTSIVLAPVELRFAFPKGRGGDLIPAIDRFLVSQKTDKSSFYFRTISKWLGGPGERYVPFWVEISLVLALALLFTLLFFSIILKKRVRNKTRDLEIRNSQLEMAVERLIQSEKRFRLHFENVTDVVYSLDNQFVIQDITPSVKQFLGYTPEELIGKSITDLHLLAPDDLERGVADTVRILAGERFAPQLYALISREGKVVFGEISSKVFKDGGRISGMVSSIRDVTKRRQAELELRQSRKRLFDTLENMLEGCQIIGFDWSYLYINKAAEQHYRRPKEELLGKRMMDVWPGVTDTRVFALEKSCMEERVTRFLDREFTFPDGTKGWFRLVIQPAPEGIVIYSEDITEKKLADEKYRESKERFDRLVSDLNDVVWTATLDGSEIVEINDSFESIYGLPPTELHGGSEAVDRNGPPRGS